MSLTNWTVSVSACQMHSAAIASATCVNTTAQRSRAGLLECAKRIHENIQEIGPCRGEEGGSLVDLSDDGLGGTNATR
jgi:hypothetical protein